jgi:isopenicillin N synthase-like dioxygenase
MSGALGSFDRIPVVDVAPLFGRDALPRRACVQALERACRGAGFFYVTGHGVDAALLQELVAHARSFFAWDVERKWALRMERGGRAWRGYFRVGDELTSGQPDQKEGLYLGQDLSPEHPLVRAGTPLHGPNVLPDAELPRFRTLVNRYTHTLTNLGHALLGALAESLGLAEDHFRREMTAEPLTLLRLFNYPAGGPSDGWGVGEHTDYGFLSILWQDNAGGLEVRSSSGWVSAPPLPGTLVCNIGDMLDRVSRGIYRSTPHRVRNVSGRDRLSIPFFFDPGFDARVTPVELPAGVHRPPDDAAQRWDRTSVHAFEGTYGEYLLNKVGKVFPQLGSAVLGRRGAHP